MCLLTVKSQNCREVGSQRILYANILFRLTNLESFAYCLTDFDFYTSYSDVPDKNWTVKKKTNKKHSASNCKISQGKYPIEILCCSKQTSEQESHLPKISQRKFFLQVIVERRTSEGIIIQ